LLEIAAMHRDQITLINSGRISKYAALANLRPFNPGNPKHYARHIVFNSTKTVIDQVNIFLITKKMPVRPDLYIGGP
jgi:hypothetical protein